METIQVQVSPELAARLRPYQDQLARVLEWGLRHVEKEEQTKRQPTVPSDQIAALERITALLRQADAIGPDPEETIRYLSSPENRRWTPIETDGEPASEMIIAERNSRPWMES